MKTKDLVKLLQTKDQTQEVEFLVVDKTTTNIVVMEITDETADLAKLLKAFKPKKKAPSNAKVSGGGTASAGLPGSAVG